MTNESLDETAKKIEINLSYNDKNGTGWAVEKISKDGKSGFHYHFIALKQQLPAINGPVELIEPIVVKHYNELKALVDEHNKQYEKQIQEENKNGKQI